MKHPVYDCDTSFEINAATRVVTNTSTNKTTLVQGDHNSERFTFTLPKMIEGHDMSLCDRVEVHYVNTENITQLQSKGVYLVEDCAVCEDDSEKVMCSWLISGNATKYAGKLEFVVRFICNDDEGNLSYAWDTAIHSGITVSKGIYNGEVIGENIPDIILQWKDDLKGERGYSVYDAGISMSLAEQPQVGDEITINYGGCEPGDFLICKINDRETGLPLRTVLLEVIEKDTTTPQPNVYKCTVSAIVGGAVILSCSTEFEFTSEPTSGYESGGVETSTFNKKPIAGDTFLMSGLYGGQYYLCTCSVRDLFADNALVNFTVLSATKIPNGLPALECNYTHESNGSPANKIYSQLGFTYNAADFNRTPVSGDFFQLVWHDTSTGERYGVRAKFSWQGGTGAYATFTPQDYWTLGAKGNDGTDGSEYYDVSSTGTCPEEIGAEATSGIGYSKRYDTQRTIKVGDFVLTTFATSNSKGQSKIMYLVTAISSASTASFSGTLKPLYFVEGEKGVAPTMYKHKIAFKNDDNESWYCEWISPSSTPVTDASTFYYFRDNAIQAGISYKWGKNGSSSVPIAIGLGIYTPYPDATYIYTKALVVSDAAVSWDTTAQFEFTSITDTVTALTN